MELPLRVLTAAVPGDPDISADGHRTACVVTRGDLHLNRWDRRVRVGDQESEGPGDRHPRWSPVGDDLFFIRADAAGIEQVVRWPDGTAVTRSAHPVRQFEWSPDGTMLAVVVSLPSAPGSPVVASSASYLRDGADRIPPLAALRVVEVGTGFERTLLDDQRSIGDISWASPTRLLVTLPHDDRSWRWDLWGLDTDASATLLTDHGEWHRAATPVADADGRVVFAGGESGVAHTEIRLLVNGECSRLFPQFDRNVTIGLPAYPGARPLWNDGEVWFTANDRGVSRLFSGGTDDATPTAHTDRHTVVTGTAVRGRHVAVTEATVTSPGRLRVLGGDWWPNDEVVVPWTVEELDGDVPGWLLRSRYAGEGPAPTLVDLHGGPHNVSNGCLGGGNLHRLMLAAQGWHILLPNFRGSDGYGTAWYRGLEATGGWCSGDVDDVLAVTDRAVESGVADRDRLAVTGYSYGGLLSAALTTVTARFKAAALGGAPVDLPTFSFSSDLGPVLCEREVGAVEAADLRSPIHRTAAVCTPTLIFHGALDRRVPASQADQWYQLLTHMGVECELAVYPGMPHGFVTSGPPLTVLDVGRRIAEWLRRRTAP